MRLCSNVPPDCGAYVVAAGLHKYARRRGSRAVFRRPLTPDRGRPSANASPAATLAGGYIGQSLARKSCLDLLMKTNTPLAQELRRMAYARSLRAFRQSWPPLTPTWMAGPC